MGRCKSSGECVICKNECLTYDDYDYFNFMGNDDLVCFGMDSDRTGGVYYPTDCYQKYIKLCLEKRLDYLDLARARSKQRLWKRRQRSQTSTEYSRPSTERSRRSTNR